MHCRWVPVRERSRSLALVYSGMFIGSILGLGCSPTLIQALGWPSVFYIFGSLGIVWFIVWRNRAASTPSEDPELSAPEKVRCGGGRLRMVACGCFAGTHAVLLGHGVCACSMAVAHLALQLPLNMDRPLPIRCT